MIRKTLYLAGGLCLLLVLLVVLQPVAGQDSAELPYFEVADCATSELTTLQSDPNYNLECGYLVTLEDRSNPDGRLVRLPVAIFRTANPNPNPDPVIYLAGGGGLDHLKGAAFYLEAVGNNILQTRDFIQYNQRGARRSDPELDCPGYAAMMWETAERDMSVEERNTHEIDFLIACRDDLLAQGIDLNMYNSAANAADANDLLIALGYEQANFYGTSYGTRLGLALMRDFPEVVRSMILDSVYPPQVDYYSEYASNINRAFQELFSACAADPDCNAKYPDLETTFYNVIDSLNEQPIAASIGQHDIFINGGFWAETIDLHLYSPQSFIYAPRAINDSSNGFNSPLYPIAEVLLEYLPTDINWAMFYSMQCREEVPFERYEHGVQLAAELPPQIGDYYFQRWGTLGFDICEVWGVEPADPIEAEPVVSDIPTLVLAGSFDPATPPEWGRTTAETLSNSFFYEFPTLGHGVMRDNACGLSIGLQFIDDPFTDPDTSCMAELEPPDFE